MSATGRSSARTNHPNDYYVTPRRTIVDFVRAFEKDTHGFFTEARNYGWPILDPAAGGDDNNEAAYPAVLNGIGLNVRTMDIRSDARAEMTCDYLETTIDYAPKMIITNPPFNLAMEFITKALADVSDGGYVVMLLRLNYFGTKKRLKFWHHCMPQITYVHHARPGFYPNRPSKTDATEYMHAVWQKGVQDEERTKWSLTRVI